MKTEPNDAAFARPTTNVHSTSSEEIAQTGLTKREYFAGRAFQALCAGEFFGTDQETAEKAVKLADALIVALNKGKE